MWWLFIMLIIAVVAMVYMNNGKPSGCSSCPNKKPVQD
jgi:hypothetical protein